jgi:hypothetical protein
MRRLAMFALVLAVAAPACDDDNNPTAQPILFTATLATSNEVPAIPSSSPEVGGSGSVIISFTGPRDSSGSFTGDATANFQFNLANFPAGTVLRGAHIHQQVAGQNGSIVVDTGLTATNTHTLTTGADQLNRPATQGVTQTLANSIASNPAGFYFNVHSNTHPGGVIRGQLTRVE